jgi:hypothetical protein
MPELLMPELPMPEMFLFSWNFLEVITLTLRGWLDDYEVTIKGADKKPFNWNCPQCVDALVETLDKMILAAAPPGNDSIPCSKVASVESQPNLSSTGNLNPISDDNTESTASGHSNKNMGQPLNDGSQSPPKDHGGNKVAEGIYELDWKVGIQFPEDRFLNHGIRAEFSSIKLKQNYFRLGSFDHTDPIKNLDVGEFDMPLHTTAPASHWKEWPCRACGIRDGIDSMCERTSMKTAAITLGTGWISRLVLAMQISVSNCRFQGDSVYTLPITSNDASTVICF